jgi:lysophospholipase L1-like esterase
MLRILLGITLLSTLHAESLRVVCFGDSTTALRKGVETYCQQLTGEQAILFNRGVPGNTTEDARTRFEADVLAIHPDIVVIQFGINDSSIDVWKSPPAAAPRVPVGRYRENLSYFIDGLQAAGARVILMTFNPLTWSATMKQLYGKPPYQPDDPAGLNVGRAEYLAAVHSVAQEKKVDLVDIDAAFHAYAQAPGHRLEDLLLDGVHPNTFGQTIVANLLRPMIAASK